MTDRRMSLDARPAAPAPRGGLAVYARGLQVQLKVIGALLMREIHTRYGRDNIGYLWLFGEPMLLAAGVGVLHSGAGSHGNGMSGVAVGVLGYTIFIIFRGCVARAEGVLESNMPLLYHRTVTIFDMMLARVVLESVACFVSFLILSSALIPLGLGAPPARPYELLVGLAEWFFWCWAVSMIVCAITHDNRMVGRLIHPITYLLMPLSGAFFAMPWIPEPYVTWLSWFPMPLIFEQLRYGQFDVASTEYIDTGYVVAWTTVLLYVGLVLIRRVRRHIHLH